MQEKFNRLCHLQGRMHPKSGRGGVFLFAKHAVKLWQQFDIILL